MVRFVWEKAAGGQDLPSSKFFPYKSSKYFRGLNCCQILYSNATDFKLDSSTYLSLLFSFLVITVPGGHVTRSCRGFPFFQTEPLQVWRCHLLLVAVLSEVHIITPPPSSIDIQDCIYLTSQVITNSGKKS